RVDRHGFSTPRGGRRRGTHTRRSLRNAGRGCRGDRLPRERTRELRDRRAHRGRRRQHHPREQGDLSVRPPPLRTIVLTAVTLVIVLTCIRLGFWQLDRLRGRKQANAGITAAQAAPPRPLPVLLAGTSDPRSLRFRRALATGTYDPAHEVLLYGRSSVEGDPGDQVLTPLRLADGTGVVVDRGWVPIDQGVPVSGEAAAPTGTVTVAGVLFPPDAVAVPTGTPSPIERITKVDVGQIGAQLPYPVLPVYLLLQTQRPPQQGPLPEPPPLPPLTNGPHLSYAFQWFSFATIAIVGYIVLMRRDRRDEVTAVAPHSGEEV